MTAVDQRINAAYADIAQVAYAFAKIPGTETALMAAAFLKALQALADARARVVLNRMTDIES